MKGEILIAISSILFGIANFIYKKYLSKFDTIAILLSMLILNLITFIPAALLFKEKFQKISKSLILTLLIYGTTFSVGGILYFYGLKNAKLSNYAILSTIGTVTTFMLSVLILKESINVKKIIALLMALIAYVLVIT